CKFVPNATGQVAVLKLSRDEVVKIVPPLLWIEERELRFSEVDGESGGIIGPSFNLDIHFGIRRVDETRKSFLNLLRCHDYQMSRSPTMCNRHFRLLRSFQQPNGLRLRGSARPK